ncbi:alpha/beta hydrolase [Actinophytocola sp.]|uniref:alpha/beta hydrolase n=1 Tax=Actinophytocola sp. TaxID=1872138 RepID=UPI00389A4A8A
MRTFVAVLTSALLLTGAVPAPAEPAWSPAPIAWGPCADFPDGECGTLRVPLDWTKPHGTSIDLAVARHRATDQAHRLGVLLVNPGGPGTSNAEFALTPNYFSPEIRARFDIVGFDARGTGGSEFIRCADPTGPPPSNEPGNPAEFDALRQYNQQVIADCRARNTPIWDHAYTSIGAQDMDAVRRALGERKISYHGISYGTLLGQQYAERYGSRVRAMVLDSNIDHSVDVRHFMGDRAAAADDAFLQFVDWCDRTESCALHGQDVLATWQRALDAADDMPQLSGNWLRDWVFQDLYAPDFDDIARVVADTAAGIPPFSAQFEYNYLSIRLATVCQDFSLRIKDFRQYSALRADELRRGPLMRGGSLGHDEATACIGIPGPPANPPHRLNLREAPTILLLNSRHDVATPYAWALDIHRQARNTALLTYEGTGHAVYTRSACTRDAADDYLLTLRTPPPGASCPAV